MSIEKALADLTSAVAENTAVQEKVLAALTSGAKPAAASGGTKAADKPASKPAGKPASKPAAKKAPTEDDLKKLFGPYLTGATDKAEKSRLNDTIRPILDEFGAPKITEIPEEHRAKAMEYGKMLVDAYNDGGIDAAEEVRFDFMGDEDGGEDEGDDVL